jgi:hypothetical protein
VPLQNGTDDLQWARVLDRVLCSADGKRLPGKWLRVLALSDVGTYGYIRYVPPENLAMPKEKLPSKLTIDEIANMFDLPAWDLIDSFNFDNYLACAESAVQDFSGTEEGRKEAYYQAQDRASERLFKAWHEAVITAAEQEFEKHEIILVPCKVKGEIPDCPYQFKIAPAKSWRRSANKIRNTINGVGYFYCADLQALLLSGPYTPREAVLAHLGYVPDCHRVYGDDEGAKSRYERSMGSFEF